MTKSVINELFVSKDWAFEKKIDGVRALAYYDQESHTKWKIFGRNYTVSHTPADFTYHVGIAPTEIPYKQLILDCEITIPEDYVDLFNARTVQDATSGLLTMTEEHAMDVQVANGFRLTINPFDVLRIDSTRIGGLSYVNRAKFLRNLTLPDSFECVPQTWDKKTKFLNQIWMEGGEGVVVKYAHGFYHPNERRGHKEWIKIKRDMESELMTDIDAFIGGFEDAREGSRFRDRGWIGAVKFYVHISDENDRIHHIATVSGMPDSLREAMSKQPELYLDRVYPINGMDVSSRNYRLSHATCDWNRYKFDKLEYSCRIAWKTLEDNIR